MSIERLRWKLFVEPGGKLGVHGPATTLDVAARAGVGSDVEVLCVAELHCVTALALSIGTAFMDTPQAEAIPSEIWELLEAERLIDTDTGTNGDPRTTAAGLAWLTEALSR